MLDRNIVPLPPSIEADQIASIAKALAHPARVRIITFLLSKPGCIGGDIVDQVGLAQSTVSEHMRILKDAGVVTGTIDYPRVCYALNPSALAPIRELIEAIAARPADGEVPCCYTPQRMRLQGDMQMTTITVYDPAMCCSTGICGPQVDQRIVDLAADLEWLKAQGVRFGLSREPAEFAANDTIRQIMQDKDSLCRRPISEPPRNV